MKSITKKVITCLFIIIVCEQTILCQNGWLDSFKQWKSPAICNWVQRNRNTALGTVALALLTWAGYRYYTNYCTAKPEAPSSQPPIADPTLPQLPSAPSAITAAPSILQPTILTSTVAGEKEKEKEEEIVSVAHLQDIWSTYKNEQFYAIQEKLKNEMAARCDLYDYDFSILGAFKPFILKPEKINDSELLPSIEFAFDLYTLLVLNDLIDTPEYFPIGQNMFYLRRPSKYTESAYKFNKQRSWPSKETFTYNYKIHLMPQKDEFIPVILTIAELLKNNKEFSTLVNGAKIDPTYTLDYDILSSKLNKEIVPSIILYIFSDATAAQKALDILFEVFKNKEFKGNGIRPRFNAQVTDLIYIAQGNGDDKKVEFIRKTGLFEMPNMIYYNHKAFEDPDIYHLKYPGTEISITETTRPPEI